MFQSLTRLSVLDLQQHYFPTWSIYIVSTCVGGDGLKVRPDQRAVMLGRYIVENKGTVRSAAGHFGISKSTVHKDIQKGIA